MKKSPTLELKKEVELLRSYIIGAAGKDDEGEYRPEFVERVFRAINEPSTEKFSSSTQFLNDLKKSA